MGCKDVFKRIKKAVVGTYNPEDLVHNGHLFSAKRTYTKEAFRNSNEVLRYVKENGWRNCFIDTVQPYEWYNKISISLGRWAIGYNFAYLLVRVLNDKRPKRILELGLGQSTKIVSRYVKFYENCYESFLHDVIEQDENWFSFFRKQEILPESTHVYLTPLEEEHFNNKTCNVYKDFKNIVKGKRYNLILIDGPWGGEYISRMDVCSACPDILEEDFVIIVDDYNRVGEKAMVECLVAKLESVGIDCAVGIYGGEKDVCLVTRVDNSFLTTM